MASATRLMMLLRQPATTTAAAVRATYGAAVQQQRRHFGTWPKVRPRRIRVITMDVTGTHPRTFYFTATAFVRRL